MKPNAQDDGEGIQLTRDELKVQAGHWAWGEVYNHLFCTNAMSWRDQLEVGMCLRSLAEAIGEDVVREEMQTALGPVFFAVSALPPGMRSWQPTDQTPGLVLRLKSSHR